MSTARPVGKKESSAGNGDGRGAAASARPRAGGQTLDTQVGLQLVATARMDAYRATRGAPSVGGDQSGKITAAP